MASAVHRGSAETPPASGNNQQWGPPGLDVATGAGAPPMATRKSTTQRYVTRVPTVLTLVVQAFPCRHNKRRCNGHTFTHYIHSAARRGPSAAATPSMSSTLRPSAATRAPRGLQAMCTRSRLRIHSHIRCPGWLLSCFFLQCLYCFTSALLHLRCNTRCSCAGVVWPPCTTMG